MVKSHLFPHEQPLQTVQKSSTDGVKKGRDIFFGGKKRKEGVLGYSIYILVQLLKSKNIRPTIFPVNFDKKVK